MGENEHFVILKKRPPESVNILKYIRQLARKVEQSIRVRVTYRVWPAVVQWGWLGVATVCYTFTCRTISPHVWSLQLRTLPPPPPVSLGHPPKLIDRQIVSNSFDNNRLENRTAESHFFPPEFESNEVETRIRIRASNDNALKWRVVSCHEMMSTLCESKKEKVACWLQLMTLSLDLCAHNNGILFTIICFFFIPKQKVANAVAGRLAICRPSSSASLPRSLRPATSTSSLSSSSSSPWTLRSWWIPGMRFGRARPAR